MNDDKKIEDFKYLLGESIKEYRMKKGKTQEYIAEKSDISIDMLSLAERGKSVLSSYNLVEVANALDTTPNHLLKDFIKNKGLLNEELISYELETLTPEEKEFILNTIKFIKQNKSGK